MLSLEQIGFIRRFLYIYLYAYLFIYMYMYVHLYIYIVTYIFVFRYFYNIYYLLLCVQNQTARFSGKPGLILKCSYIAALLPMCC